MFQSSPAHVGRALTITNSYLPVSANSFNPRPPTWGGRSRLSEFLTDTPEVSILARPRGAGARKRRENKEYEPFVSILARPRGAGALMTFPSSDHLDLFQSSPAHVGRALDIAQTVSRLIESFNPRPPTWGGRSQARTLGDQAGYVSILARPRGAGALDLLQPLIICRLVSILARPRGAGARCGF